MFFEIMRDAQKGQLWKMKQIVENPTTKLRKRVQLNEM